MSQPETAQDVAELVRKANLVREPDLAASLARLPEGQSPAALFALLMAGGLLTRYQADELGCGRWQGFWLGPYKILDRLGKGGMGHVYLAEHGVLKKRMAVKVLSVGLRSDPTARRRFVLEARAAAALEHPNVVHVYDVDMDHDPPFLVMEYVEGVSLQAAVSLNGTFTGGEAAMVGVEVARGLEAAAAAGLVHRDVKPANLLVDRRAGIKILDLGIVRVHGDETQPRADGVDVILGTLDYLAPEQAENSSAVDPRADLYALGATLYFLLAGHPPFPGTDIRHKLAAKQYSDPPPIHRVRPDVEVALSEIVQKMMARDPAARHQSAAEVVAALTPFAQLSSAFPARLFRPDRPSTVNDDYPLPAAESSSLPATVRMLKPSPRPLPPLPPLATPEAATDELLKAPTAVEMPPLPAELIATQPAKPLAAVAVAEPLVQPVRQLWPWLLLAALSFSAILAAVLALR